MIVVMSCRDNVYKGGNESGDKEVSKGSNGQDEGLYECVWIDVQIMLM